MKFYVHNQLFNFWNVSTFKCFYFRGCSGPESNDAEVFSKFVSVCNTRSDENHSMERQRYA